MAQETITFLRDYQVKGADGESYKEGQEVQCSPESAVHFISRGAARRGPAEKSAKPAKARGAGKPAKAESEKGD